jgi:hypothetical protein
VPFVVFGGMAVATWIEPRTTNDCDIVVMARRRDAARLKLALLGAGARVTSLEMRWVFERTFVRFKTEGPMLDVHLVATRHDRSAFAQAQVMVYGGQRVRIVRPEDLILYKLKAWRLRDQADIVDILTQVPNLDRGYVDSWLDAVGQDSGVPARDRWDRIRRLPAQGDLPLLMQRARSRRRTSV